MTKNFTGDVVGASYQTLNLVSVLMFVIGVVIVLASADWNKYRTRIVIEEYESGELNPVQAAMKINKRLFPRGFNITGVDYRGGTSETIKTEKQFIPVML